MHVYFLLSTSTVNLGSPLYYLDNILILLLAHADPAGHTLVSHYSTPPMEFQLRQYGDSISVVCKRSTQNMYNIWLAYLALTAHQQRRSVTIIIVHFRHSNTFQFH